MRGPPYPTGKRGAAQQGARTSLSVFMSHSSADRRLVGVIATELKSCGVATWMDEDQLLLGESLAKSIRRAIRVQCDFVVFLLSRKAARSAWVRREFRWALAEERHRCGRPFVLPVLLHEEVLGVSWLERFLETRRFLACFDHSRRGVSRLAEGLRDELRYLFDLEPNCLISDQVHEKAHGADRFGLDDRKHRFGVIPYRGHRELSARVVESWNHTLSIRLTVRSTSPRAHPLRGRVRFYLHSSFKKPTQTVRVKRGLAVLDEWEADNAFTVGAIADQGSTMLELDLAQLPGAPRWFTSVKGPRKSRRGGRRSRRKSP